MGQRNPTISDVRRGPVYWYFVSSELPDIVGALEAAALVGRLLRLARARLERRVRGTAVNGFDAAQSGVRWRQQAINGVEEGFPWHWLMRRLALRPSLTRSRCSIDHSKKPTAGKFLQGASSSVEVTRLAFVSYCSEKEVSLARLSGSCMHMQHPPPPFSDQVLRCEVVIAHSTAMRCLLDLEMIKESTPMLRQDLISTILIIYDPCI